MKNFTLSTLILVTLFVTDTDAQAKNEISIGPIVGFGNSWMSYDFGGIRKFNPSYNGGLRLVYNAFPHFDFGIDGTIRTEGYKHEVANSFKHTIHFNYIHIDPKIYYFFGRYDNNFRPKIGFGPGFGFLVGGKSTFYNGLTTDVLKSKDIFAGFDFGLSGLIGFNYHLKNRTWLNVDAVYNHGLSNIKKNGSVDFQNRSLFMNVGVTFGIGHAGEKGLKEIKVMEKKI